jgi:hypothetical protein
MLAMRAEVLAKSFQELIEFVEIWKRWLAKALPSDVVKGVRDIGQVLARQAAKAREIADRLEDAKYIRVGTVKASNKNHDS